MGGDLPAITSRVKRLLFVAVAALLAAGCGGSGSARRVADAAERQCPAKSLPGWQKLSKRIGAPVYCPTYMPDPLDGVIGSRWNNIDAVSRDRSYLESFVWQETEVGPNGAGGELHVNLRGYPGRTRIPTCTDVNTVNGVTRRGKIPCFSDPTGHRRVAGIDATVYTANQDADRWHVLYAWRRGGSLYTLSQHVAVPLTYRKVVADLDHMLRSLVLVRPSS
jgi:hypothetical protein